MDLHSLRIRNLGPIADVGVELGDLTVLVGPQGSGKSLFLQTLKATLDMDAIVDALKRHGYAVVDDQRGSVAELLYGEGMGSALSPATLIEADGRAWSLPDEAKARWSKKSRGQSRVFYIPAQRVLTLSEGWPRPFTAFDIGVPYVVKQFSEDLRRLLDEGLEGEAIFPAERRWKPEIREQIADAIFHGAEVKVDRARMRKRIVLEPGAGNGQLPFMSWSAGQREFIPLMLGLYGLMPTQATPARQPIRWAIIEEPEMGLHPAAISAVLLAILDLLRRGYRVVVSTHSPHVLELLWAIRALRQHEAFAAHLLGLFGLGASGGLRELAEAIRAKEFRVYAFRHQEAGGVVAKDISTLDPSDDDPDVAAWGGLTDFAERAASEVAAAVATA